MQVVAARFRPRTPRRRRTRKRKKIWWVRFCGFSYFVLSRVSVQYLGKKRNRNFSYARGLVLFESCSCLVLSLGVFDFLEHQRFYFILFFWIF
jgi:hypothetical protein